MIQTDADLEVVRKQLGRLETALQDLEEEVRPQSEKQFRLMSEIYVEHIARLRGEIDQYCGKGKGKAQSSPIHDNRVVAKRRPA